jgi:hypothetical protein
VIIDSVGFTDTVLLDVSFAYLIQCICEIYAVYSHDTITLLRFISDVMILYPSTVSLINVDTMYIWWFIDIRRYCHPSGFVPR